MSPVLTADTAAATPATPATPGAPGDAPDARTPGRRAYRHLHLGAGVMVLGVLTVGVAVPGGAAAHTVAGTVQLWQDASAGADGASCAGRGADADISAGAEVRIKDANGTPLATSTLTAGRSDGAACVFGFVAPDVPKAGSYRIAVGDPNRPSAPFTYRDMHAAAWDVRVILGA